jgi:hypothetical protein
MERMEVNSHKVISLSDIFISPLEDMCDPSISSSENTNKDAATS